LEGNHQLTDIAQDEHTGDGSADITSGLHVGRTASEIVQFNNLSKSTMKRL
jgi:hypothetical protein